MTNQHRATPEQWALTEAMLGYATSSCLIELRDRIQLLESTQPPRLPAPAPSPRPSTLVERVADAIGAADDEGLTNMTWSKHSRDAIRAVAAWINECELKAQNNPDCLEASTADEVVGWLRNEADR